MRWLSILRDSAWPEVLKTWPFFLFLTVPSASWWIAGYAAHHWGGTASGGTEVRHVVYFGTLLELSVLLLVAVGLVHLGRQFKRTPVFTAMLGRVVTIWHSAFNRDKNIALSGVASVGTLGSLAVLSHGTVRGTTKQRLDALERDVTDLRKQRAEFDRTVEGKFSELRSELSAETQERIAAHAEIKRELGTVAVDIHYLDLIGLWWLVIGTVATCVPDELVRLGQMVF